MTKPIRAGLRCSSSATALCWASDYPPVLCHMTYQQSLEAGRTHSTFIPKDDLELILGGNLARLLDL